jgi:hypothetical protein
MCLFQNYVVFSRFIEYITLKILKYTIFSYVYKKKDSYQNYLIMMFYDAVYQFILT